MNHNEGSGGYVNERGEFVRGESVESPKIEVGEVVETKEKSKMIDLESLRIAAKGFMGEEVVLSRDEQISRLRREIEDEEALDKGPTDYDKFMALTPEEKDAELARQNKGLFGEDKYTIDELAEELKPKGGPSLHSLRAAVKRAELERLLAEQ